TGHRRPERASGRQPRRRRLGGRAGAQAPTSVRPHVGGRRVTRAGVAAGRVASRSTVLIMPTSTLGQRVEHAHLAFTLAMHQKLAAGGTSSACWSPYSV